MVDANRKKCSRHKNIKYLEVSTSRNPFPLLKNKLIKSLLLSPFVKFCYQILVVPQQMDQGVIKSEK